MDNVKVDELVAKTGGVKMIIFIMILMWHVEFFSPGK